MRPHPDAVVKVGGSLFDLPDLRSRLTAFLERLPWQCVLLVPGGGPTADAVRALDRCHGLGEEASHWLALEAMTLNAHFLAALLPGATVVPDWNAGGGRQILDAGRFVRSDEGRPEALPHLWSVTSDSVAARAAERTGAPRLILLKSTSETAAGWVDAYFPRLVARAGSALYIQAVNLRTWTP